jgi:hypothetical protein
MSAAELTARAWAPGTDFPEPKEINWLYHLGLAVICVLWIISLIVVGLRVWARKTAKQMGAGECLNTVAEEDCS